MQLRNCPPSGVHFKFSAAPCNESILVEFQAEMSTNNFKTSSALIVSHDQIHQTQRHGIECADSRHPEFAGTKTPAILHRCLEASGENDHIKNLSNSSRVMERNRTRSP